MSKDRVVWKTYTSVGWASERDGNHVVSKRSELAVSNGKSCMCISLRRYIGEFRLKEIAITGVAKIRKVKF